MRSSGRLPSQLSDVAERCGVTVTGRALQHRIPQWAPKQRPGCVERWDSAMRWGRGLCAAMDEWRGLRGPLPWTQHCCVREASLGF